MARSDWGTGIRRGLRPILILPENDLKKRAPAEESDQENATFDASPGTSRTSLGTAYPESVLRNPS